MAERWRRAADRRREREGEELLDEPQGEHTAVQTVGGEWVGDQSGLLGNVAADGGSLQARGSAFDEPQNTGELARPSILAESERVEGRAPVEETSFAHRPMVAEAAGARLLVIAGLDKGRGQDLIFLEMVIGRSERADVVLRDPAVSREHASIRFVDGVFEVVDLGSESGTFVNGRKVSRAVLGLGDEIELGDSILRFLASDLKPERRPEPVDVAAPAEGSATVLPPTQQVRVAPAAPPSRAFSRLLIALVALILLGALAAGGGLYYLNAVGRVRVGLEPGLAELLRKAREALAAGRPQEALDIARTFLDARPRDQEARAISDEAVRQLGHRRTLLELRAVLARGDLAAAQALLDKLPTGNPLRAEGEQALHEAREEVRTASLDAARRLIDEDALDAADKLLDAHDKRWGEDEEAGALRAELAAIRADQRAQGRRHVQRVIDAALRPAAQAFARGELDEARRLLRAIGGGGAASARAMSGRIDTFARALERGQQAHLAKQAEAGLRALDEAARLDRDLAFSEGSIYTQRIAGMRADLHYLLGVRALGQGDRCAARERFSQARRLNPGDAKHGAQLEQLARQADDALLRAQKLQSADPARARDTARQALCLVEPGHPVRKRLETFLR